MSAAARSASGATSGPRTIGARALAAQRVSLPVLDDSDLPHRPVTRGDCVDGPRPCPWVGCRHNAYLEVNRRTGSIKLNFPGVEPDEMTPSRSCTLDIADDGPITLDLVGGVLNVNRERSRQLEADAMGSLHVRAFHDDGVASILREHAIDPDPNRLPQGCGRGSHDADLLPSVEDLMDDKVDGAAVDDMTSRTSVSFFAGSDAAVCESVWSMLSKLWGIRPKGSIAATKRLAASRKGSSR